MGLLDGLKSENPEKEFGAHLVQLVEMALADKILTSSEKSMLLGVAKQRGVDIKKFEKWVKTLMSERGVKELQDGNIPLKKYSEATKMTAELKSLIDMALADGYLSDEERAMILKEASKLGLNMQAFEAGLNAIFMTGNVKKVIDAKYPTEIVRRLVDTEDLPDGKVADIYEEIMVAYRPNTNRGKEGQIRKTTTKKKLRVVREKDTVAGVVDFLCSVDFTIVISALTVVQVFSPAVGGMAISLVTTLKKSVDSYKTSGNKNNPAQFFAAIGKEVPIEKCLETLPGVKSYLGGHGDKIVNCLVMAQKMIK